LIYLYKVAFLSRAIFGAKDIYYNQNNRNELDFMETKAIFAGISTEQGQEHNL
jgi:hypothetical protein